MTTFCAANDEAVVRERNVRMFVVRSNLLDGVPPARGSKAA